MNVSMIYPQIISVFYCMLIMISFFTKKKIKTMENNIFGTMIVGNLVGLFLDIIAYMSAYYTGASWITVFICKFIQVYLILWIMTMTLYIYIISSGVSYSDEIKQDQKWRKYKTLKIIIITLEIIFCFICSFLPMNVVIKGYVAYSTGLSNNMIYGISAILMLVWIIILFSNMKAIKDKKFYPIYAYIILGAATTIIQYFYPEIIIITPVETFITILMYFTIENPDVKMLNEVKAAKDAADKANQAKSDFLSSMSHEIRTPLNAIVGFSECIKNADNLEEAKENASDIVTASESLLEIVNGILDISKIESGKLELVQTDYDIYKILDEVVKLIKARLGDKPLNFEVNIAPDIPHVLYGDYFNIKKILINFLTNAVKYTDEGYIKFDVRCVKVNDEVCRLIMSVKDSGRGIKKENIDKLFTKFQRLDEDKNTTIEGTGLGLAITKQLVEMMHGKIVVNSTYGEGSEFTAAIDQRISNAKLDNEETVVEGELDLTNKNILVVDDNTLNLKVATKLLKPYKCNVEVCESGFACLDKIKEGKTYDIILLDDMMPKMKGSETLTRLKQIDGFNIPVIALTANAIQGMKEQYLLLGFDDYLAKPIEKKELYRVLNKYVLKAENKASNSSNLIQNNEVEIDYVDYTGKNILIVDDNLLNIKVATKIMKPYNFTIDYVCSGAESLDKVKEKHYDIIFMDYMMPNMDGIETFKNLSKIEGFNTPVVALTADAVVGAKDKFIEAGFTDYVSKPIDKHLLNDVINKILKK